MVSDIAVFNHRPYQSAVHKGSRMVRCSSAWLGNVRPLLPGPRLADPNQILCQRGKRGLRTFFRIRRWSSYEIDFKILKKFPMGYINSALNIHGESGFVFHMFDNYWSCFLPGADLETRMQWDRNTDTSWSPKHLSLLWGHLRRRVCLHTARVYRRYLTLPSLIHEDEDDLRCRKDGLSCRHGVKPPLTYSLLLSSCIICERVCVSSKPPKRIHHLGI